MNAVTVTPRSDLKGWYITFYEGTKRVRITKSTKTSAQKYASDIRHNLRNFGHPRPDHVDDTPAMTIEDLVHGWLHSCKRRNLSKHTMASYRGHGLALIRFLGERYLFDLTREDLETWGDEMRKHYSWEYERDLLRVIRMATKELAIDYDPTKFVRRPRKPVREVRFYTLDQVREMLDKCFPAFRGVLALHLFAGARPSEAGNLKPDHIHREDSRIVVFQGKRGKRSIEEPPEIVWDWLERYPYNATNYKRNIAQLARECDFDWIQDGLRHTFATYSTVVHGAGKTAGWTGHKNPYTLHNHYVGVVRKSDGEEFFKISP